jgi:hypothetical protein
MPMHHTVAVGYRSSSLQVATVLLDLDRGEVAE